MARSFFPTGQLTLNGSVVVQADNVTFDISNSMTQKATLANKNATNVDGMRTAKVTFDLLVDDTGPEIPMIEAVLNASALALGWKFPGNVTISLDTNASSAKPAQKLGDVWTIGCEAMGHVVDSQGI